MSRRIARVRNISGHLTVLDVSNRWGVSTRSVIHAIENKVLDAIKNDGFWQITEGSVHRAEAFGERPRPHRVKERMRSPFQINAAEAYRLFRAGAKCSDVVVALNITPHEVDALYASFKNDDLEDRRVEKMYGG